jgi:hypothetical protein
MAASMAEPGHSNPGAERQGDALASRLDASDDLMAGDDRQLDVGQFAVDHMEVRAAHPAGLDRDTNLPRPGLRLGSVLHCEPVAGPPQNHGAHRGFA